MANEEKNLKLQNVYLARIGRRQGQEIWIVDGAFIAREIYPEWIFGGNDMRYCFNPPDEVWIDSRVGVEELETTILHELVERKLMKEDGKTYDEAHNQALKLELTLRPKWERQCLSAGKKLVAHAQKHSLRKLLGVPAEKLHRLYRQPVGTYRGNKIWIVDGSIVRQHLDANYGSVDSLDMSDFVPENEFWLDSSMSTFESYFALFKRKALYQFKSSGLTGSKAYDQALDAETAERKRMCSFAARHELLLEPVSYGARERGPHFC